ncbi:right-handed parallel beta-helix repeat-containing protein [Cellulomonas telluris]|uniref:right-handed parallel beta-helix repeat-containing protein n=1 Tax=Cellulomonas telluris TaxID=2306636 RepID=UPI0010A83E5B|nr:right-handed parallel beta-helix repeat-containing protein [Cellulomonas telluris]
MRARAGLAALALALGAVLAAPPASASSASPACGDTLTRDTVLAADLTCADGPGLRLAPGVSLDLGGHTLRGPGHGVGVEVATAGTAAVRGGTVAGWATGVGTVVVTSAPRGPLAVDRMTFRDNAEGLDVSGEPGTGDHRKVTTVTASRFAGNGTAVLAAWFGTVRVNGTTFADNATAVVLDGGGGTVTRSRFVRNELAVVAVEADADVSGSTFVANTVGVRAAYGAMATLRDDEFVGSEVAVDAETGTLTVSGSRFTANGTGVVLGLLASVVEGSTFQANGTGVTHRGAWREASRIEGNVLRLNGDGIHLDPADPLVAIGGNDVRHNARWGVHAPGATDLGGNVARGNGYRPPCLGVVCRWASRS